MAKQKPKKKTERPEDILRRLGGEQLGDDLVMAYQELKETISDSDTTPVRLHWRIGQTMEQINLREAELAKSSNKGGQTKLRGAIALGKMLKITKTMARNSKNIYEAWPREKDLTELMSLRRKADDMPLGLSVITVLSEPAFATNRKKYFAQACAQSLTLRDVLEIRKKLAGEVAEVNRQGGKQHKLPTSMQKAIDRWKRDSGDMLRYTEAIFTEDAIKDLQLLADFATIDVAQFDEVLALTAKTAAALQRRQEVITLLREKRLALADGVEETDTVTVDATEELAEEEATPLHVVTPAPEEERAARRRRGAKATTTPVQVVAAADDDDEGEEEPVVQAADADDDNDAEAAVPAAVAVEQTPAGGRALGSRLSRALNNARRPQPSPPAP